MNAAHRDRHALGAELIGDLIAAIDVARHRGNPDEIALQIEVDRLNVLVGEDDLILVAGNGGGDGEQAGEGRIERSVHINRAGRKRVRLRVYEMNDTGAHRNSPRGERPSTK